MTASSSTPVSQQETDDRLRLIVKEIHSEEIPERLLILARKLQSALDDRDAGNAGDKAVTDRDGDSD